MLPQDELRRRLIAARELRGISQDQLTAQGAELGLGRQELARAERGTIDLTPARINTITGILGLPPNWFTAPTVDDLLGVIGNDGLLKTLETITDRLNDQRSELVAQGERIEEMDRRIVRQLSAAARERATGTPATPRASNSGPGLRAAED